MSASRRIVDDTSSVTRVEVIDHRSSAGDRGRVYAAWDCLVTLSRQDGGRTLKVFVDDSFPKGPDV